MDSAPTRDGGRPRVARPVDAPSHTSGADTGWGVTGTLLSGLLVWGAVGWLLDHWLDTRVFVVIGGILGLAASIYLVAVKYGGGSTDQPTSISSTSYSKISSTSYSTYRKTPGGRRSQPRTQKGQR